MSVTRLVALDEVLRYQDIGVVPIVNAQGPSTPLGGGALSEGVLLAMTDAGRGHVVMDDLWRAAGREIARIAGAGDACVTTGAAAGIAISTAAVVAGTDAAAIAGLPATDGRPSEVLVQKGHAISFSGAPIRQMVALGGGDLVEVGAVNGTPRALLEASISDRTAALLYVTSQTHAVHRRTVGLAACVDIGRERGIPVIVDAAGEGDLRSLVASGADLISFSGGKVFGGPTSGFICGGPDLIEACRAQNAGIARPMKVSKEATMGLLQGLREHERAIDDGHAVQRERMQVLEARLAGIPGLVTRATRDDAGRPIFRAEVVVDADIAGRGADALVEELARATPAIFVRDFKVDTGVFEIDPRSLPPGGEDLIVARLTALLGVPAEATP